MATTIIKKAIIPLNNVIELFMRQTEAQIKHNLDTQKIWPEEVYPGYKQKNEYNKQHGYPHSTGDGRRTFRSRLISASSAGNVTLQFSFNAYMRYVDIGVGGKTTANEVERGKKANGSRYISIWDRSKGISHRPAVMMEIRHLSKRIEGYLSDFYGVTKPIQILNTVSNLSIDLNL